MIYFALIELSEHKKNHDDQIASYLNQIQTGEIKKIKLGNMQLYYAPEQYSSTSDISVISSSNSVFIGTGFSKINNYAIKTQDLPQNFKAHLDFSKNYWGNYVLFTYDKDNKTLHCSRAPAGQIPFYYHEVDKNLMIISSRIEAINRFIRKPLNFNWNYLLASLFSSLPLGSDTAFKEIKELPLGCYISCNKAISKVSLCWNPLDYIKSNSNYSAEGWGKIIYSNLSVVLEKWLQNSNAYLEFSGGIDSTALHFAINESIQSQNVYQALHLYNNHSAASNELTYVEKLTRQINKPLEVINYLEYLPYAPIKLSFKPCKPALHFPYQNHERRFLEIINQNKKFQFVNGHGGDNLLMSNPYYALLTDYMLQNGIKGSFNYLKEFGVFRRTNIYHILAGTFQGFYSYISGSKMSGVDSYFEAPWLKINVKEFNKNAKELMHPFNHIPRGVVPGKQKQINSLYEVLDLLYTSNIRCPGNYIFYPFLSQPIVELLLSIPTYHFFKKTYSRYPIRHEIHDRFKTDTIWRKDKGEFSNIEMLGLQANYNYILDLLMNGSFAAKDYINKDQLKISFENLIAGDNSLQSPISKLIILESFLSYWS